MPDPKIKVFLDVGSPYSYIAFEILCRYREVWCATVQFIPVLLGAVFKATVNQSPVMVPAKGTYTMLDIQRTCRLAAIPFTSPPSNFGSATFNTLPALRMLTAAQQVLPSEAQFEQLLRICYLMVFNGSAQQPVQFDATFLERCCRRAGFTEPEAQNVLQAAGSAQVKAQLKAQTEQAVSTGMFGAPFIVVDHPALPVGQNHFFGSDRLEQIAALMGKPWLGPQPRSCPSTTTSHHLKSAL